VKIARIRSVLERSFKKKPSGPHARFEKRFDLLVPLVNITIALDPRLEIAYRYGATFLAEPFSALSRIR